MPARIRYRVSSRWDGRSKFSLVAMCNNNGRNNNSGLTAGASRFFVIIAAMNGKSASSQLWLCQQHGSKSLFDKLSVCVTTPASGSCKDI